MRILIGLFTILAACSGPATKPASPLVEEGSAVPEACCCKHTPIASPDGNPVFEKDVGRMDCSAKQGTCVDAVQCEGDTGPAGPPEPGIPLEEPSTR